MKTIGVREMKAKWAQVEADVAAGEEYEVLNRGKPTVRLVAAAPRKDIKWDNYLETAYPGSGPLAEEIVRAGREGGY